MCLVGTDIVVMCRVVCDCIVSVHTVLFENICVAVSPFYRADVVSCCQARDV